MYAPSQWEMVLHRLALAECTHFFCISQSIGSSGAGRFYLSALDRVGSDLSKVMGYQKGNPNNGPHVNCSITGRSLRSLENSVFIYIFQATFIKT